MNLSNNLINEKILFNENQKVVTEGNFQLEKDKVIEKLKKVKRN